MSFYKNNAPFLSICLDILINYDVDINLKLFIRNN